LALSCPVVDCVSLVGCFTELGHVSSFCVAIESFGESSHASEVGNKAAKLIEFVSDRK
jgi:hypothetical protein